MAFSPFNTQFCSMNVTTEAALCSKYAAEKLSINEERHKPAFQKTWRNVINLYRGFLNNSFELMVQTQMDGKIIFVNSVFLKTLDGKNKKELREKNISAFFIQEKDTAELIKTAAMDEAIRNKISFLQTTAKKKVVALANISKATNFHLEPILNWTFIDITQSYEQEIAARQSHNELDKINRQMERFLYSTSHDLRSPAATVLGLLNLLRLESNDTIVLDYVSKIGKSVHRLESVLNNLVSFSQNNYQHVSRTPINVREWLNQFAPNYQNSNQQLFIEISVEGTEGIFYSDPNRLNIILTSLLQNTIQFLDPQKLNSFLRIKAVVNHQHLLLSLTDNGIGIGKAHLGRIFDMFYKATERSQGAGLGLYIAKEAVEKLNGKISVESEYGIGSCFTVEIPNDIKGILLHQKKQRVNHKNSGD
jgi:signal transduction histidine kinase